MFKSRKNEADRKGSKKRGSSNFFRGSRPKKDKSALDPNEDCYLIIDRKALDALSKYISCKKCGSEIKFDIRDVYGLAFNLKIICRKCADVASIPSSRPIRTGNQKDINVRATLSLRMLGQGQAGLKTLCGLMNTHPPITQHTDESYIKMMLDATKKISLESMKEAAEEEVELTGQSDIAVSGDGTWRRQGFSSLQGVATLVGAKTGKVIDAVTKNSFCLACENAKKRITDATEFEIWSIDHVESGQCKANHEENAGKMEVSGMIEMFRRSRRLHGVRYVNYIGDGDSKVYANIVNSKVYGETGVKKLECVGHVQKRMGAHLRNLKKEHGKRVGGAGKLTLNYIKKLTAYYGKAIRTNSNSVEDMYRAVWATFYHESSTDAVPKHSFCPEGRSSWCKYQRAVCEGREFRHKSTMPEDVWDLVRPVYEQLSNRNLLSRCLGGFTQNQNESLNAKIWKLAPKKTYSGVESVEIAVAIAIITFNGGYEGLARVFEEIGLNVGEYTFDYLEHMDTQMAKKRSITGQRLSSGDAEALLPLEQDSDWEEDLCYSAGIAD